MRVFDYLVIEKTPLPSDIVSYLTQIHEFRGKQDLYSHQQPEMLEALLMIAKIQSIGASNRIEGISTTEKRLHELAKQSVVPKNRNEKEIAGYQNVLETIHDSYAYIPVTSNIILQLHRDLYRFSESSLGGHFKISDNIIEEIGPDGQHSVRFTPMSAFETPAAMDGLCTAYTDAISHPKIDPLILVPLFILDFLCIHPFNDGNGRMSRLLTLLLLYQNNFTVGKYISMEALIEKAKDTYYDVLQESSVNWIDNDNQIWPFVRYLLGIILAAYRELDLRMGSVEQVSLTKQQRIRLAVDRQIGLFTKRTLLNQCPDIAKITVEKTLAEMKAEGLIEPVGMGRSAKWKKIL